VVLEGDEERVLRWERFDAAGGERPSEDVGHDSDRWRGQHVGIEILDFAICSPCVGLIP
jgi:hypothetical protein